MPSLTADRFPEFFQAVRGYEPFPWQAELAAELVNGSFPRTIDVPTGFGKTSVIDCWAFALAAHAARQSRGVPLRLCFVVDRRLIVDGAHEEAVRLQERLTSARDGVVAEVATALTGFAGPGTEPLTVVRMRGGVTWESRWLARPDQPAVVVGTVDQFGSRFLFRGYGVSESMRPINTALVGLDTWLVVDEAHIAEPLVRTVQDAVRHQKQVERQHGFPPLRLTTMSATTREEGGSLRADLDLQERSDRFPAAAARAAMRLAATKPATLLDLSFLARAAKDKRSERWRELGRAMATLARQLDGQVIAIVTNTIPTARAAYDRLRAEGEQAMLLIGRVRGYERDRIQEEWIPRILAGRGQEPAERLFVVATQTIEVGANLDFDALVTECAPLSSLIQRFGRVNRLGERPDHRSLIVHAGFAHDNNDPVYGPATAKTWEYLSSRDDPVALASERALLHARFETGAGVEFGIRQARRLAREAPDETYEETPFTPVLLGAHLERWAATSPSPEPDQPVAPFLHGIDRYVPEVEVAWRAAPPTGRELAEAWRDWLSMAPPVEWEFVAVPIWEARRLLGQQGTEDRPFSDLEGAVFVDDDSAAGREREPGSRDRVFGVVYEGPESDPSLVRGPGDIHVGDRLVLCSDVGGHDEWGWTGKQEDRTVPDVADLAPTRRRGVLQLSKSVLETWLEGDDERALLDEALAPLATDEPLPAVPLVLERLQQISGLAPFAERFDKARAWQPILAVDEDEVLRDNGAAVVVLAEPRRTLNRSRRQTLTGEDGISDEDTTSSSLAGAPVPLDRHGQDVGETARQFAMNLGLRPELQKAVALAGRLHDLGKADERFQAALRGGDLVAARAAVDLLAKSGGDPRDPAARRARALVGLPRGFRHEAVSARLVDRLSDLAPGIFADVDRELVRHLVVSHHGKGRPLLPAILDPVAPAVELELEGQLLAVDGATRPVDWSQPGRFERLCQRYGWWGLAYMETLVRLADMLCSEEGR